jgi:monovalent cation:H+ antiporter-2, CPA2 family
MYQDSLQNIVIIIATAVFVVAIFKKLNLSPVLGYFVAGGVIGENGLKVITSHETEFFGEIGVVFLLFAIGLELTFERLKSMRLHVFGFGSLQVTISMILLALTVYFFGKSVSAAILIGGGLALSSTAIVLQVLYDAREQSTKVGRLSLAILLMQDFAVVPLLVIVPILAGEQSGVLTPLLLAFGKAVLVLIIIFVMGRLLLRPIFRIISSDHQTSSNELFIAMTILVAIGTAYLTNYMGLSLALGAFAAGLLVAETEFQIPAEESIAPFKALLLGLFFMSVGMSIDLKLIYDQLPLITALSVGLILLKAVIIFILCLLFKFSIGVALQTGLLLSQGGEFAFILFRLADQKGVIDSDISQMLLLVVTITMAFTPLLSLLGKFLANKFTNEDKTNDTSYINMELGDLNKHVILLGFGRVGRMVAKLLEAENVNYVILDIDSEHVVKSREEGYPIYLGDISSLEMLKTIGIERANAIIIAIANNVTTKKASKLIKQNFAEIPIVVRAEDLKNSDEYYSAGANVIVPETYETGLQLGAAVLRTIGINDNEISRIKNLFRASNYKRLPESDSNK